MKVHLACGGTGGHIFPGLATAARLRARGHDVTLWLAGKDVENTAVQGWDGPVVTVRAEGFPSGLSWRAVRTAWRLSCAIRDCRRKMAKDRPEVLLAMGSYASVGPSLAAFHLKVPVVLHEANVIPGRAIAWLARRATAVAAHFEETRYYLRRKEIVVTGLPLRAELIAEGAAGPAEPPGPFTILVMGGSRGARRLNALVKDAAGAAQAAGGRFHVIHLTGAADEAEVRAFYEQAGVSHEVHAFAHRMADFYRRAHVAICRSGAATCAELLRFGVPSLQVPYPFAASNHQLANARTMEKMGVADVVEEKDLESDWLAEYLLGSLCDPERLQRMRRAAASRPAVDGAEALADLVEQTGRTGHGSGV